MGATLQFGDKSWDVTVKFSQIDAANSPRSPNSLQDFIKRDQRIAVFTDDTIKQIQEILTETNQQTRSAKLIMTGGKAVEFDPGQNGQAVDVWELSQVLIAMKESIKLPALISQPNTKLSDTNSLGITQLVAVGESNFSGSPKNRVHNINVGASKYQGVIIKPGEEFSFNKFLGEVDGEHGFLPELVIKRAGLVPEFGGGLCQVSSTTFRAAMNAGFPITERQNHSFAVSYYAPQGSDATIYPGATDLRFVNDLSSHLLIRTRIEKNKLYFDFYGTKDTRVVELDGPYQYDKKPDGSMKAEWTKKVTKNSEAKEQTFKSAYVSPALFPKVSTIQPQTPNPPPPETINPAN